MPIARPQSDATALVESGTVFLRGDALSKEDVAGILTRIIGEFDIASTLAGKAEDGRRADDVDVVLVTERLPGWGTFNFAFGGSYGEDDRLTFSVSLNNILDKEYRPTFGELPRRPAQHRGERAREILIRAQDAKGGRRGLPRPPLPVRRFGAS